MINNYISKLNEAINNLYFGNKPVELYDPLRYMLSLGGKRIRPLLTLLSYSLEKNNWESIIKPALAVEVFHNFTLIHDDIMDKALLRRGKPTVYKKWNKDIAILSGDVMMVKAYELLLESKIDNISLIIKLFNKCAIEVCEGQQLDMNFERINIVSESDYINMIRLKTAVLLGFSLELGGLLGGMSSSETVKLRTFGINMGIGFQLKDDILDVYGNQKKFGKQVGNDIKANKKTYLLVKALELANEEELTEINIQLNKKDFITGDKVESLRNIYSSIGIKEIAEIKMNQYFNAAFENLSQLNIKEEKLKFLKNFAKSLLNREN